jgi:hypothetical protein
VARGVHLPPPARDDPLEGGRMQRRRLVTGLVLAVGVLTAIVGHAITAFSVGAKPIIYRASANNNDLDGVEGLGTPGRVVQLWARQRNFKDGTPDGADAFQWCAWKNNANPTFVGWTVVGSNGVFRFANLRAQTTTIMLFPPSAGDDVCRGGLYTELLLLECDNPGGGNCTTSEVPTMHYLNVRQLPGSVGAAAGKISNAHQAAIAIADGPNDGPEFSDVVDVDQNGFDTTTPGAVVGQPIEWRCGTGGTAPCPSIAIHDGSTALETDPEFPYVLATLQGHRPGGSIIATAARARNNPLGFTVNVNVKFRGQLDVNLGCDRASFFDFGVPLNF